MKHFLLLLVCSGLMTAASAQDKKPTFIKPADKPNLPDIKTSISNAQANLALFTKNAGNHSQEHDVNSIILEIEKYIDSMPRTRTAGDQLLMKQFNPMRHFFLTTTNKTTVATSFLYTGTPYTFCYYNDTAVALHLYAIRDGDTYNLGKMTEKKVMRTAFSNCLLPSLKALDEFKDNEIKYIGVSIYYGCKDSRDGAPAGVVVPYCLTLVARTSDLQQFAAGLITQKGLLAVADLYLSDEEDSNEIRKISLNVE